jgi:hypothetical protein
MSMSICQKTTTLIFLDLKLVHHFLNRKLVIQSQYIFQANPTPANFILLLLVTGHVLLTTTSTSGSGYFATDSKSASLSWCWGSMTRFFITVRNLQSSCCEAPSLMRGRVCNLLVQFVA